MVKSPFKGGSILILKSRAKRGKIAGKAALICSFMWFLSDFLPLFGKWTWYSVTTLPKNWTLVQWGEQLWAMSIKLHIANATANNVCMDLGGNGGIWFYFLNASKAFAWNERQVPCFAGFIQWVQLACLKLLFLLSWLQLLLCNILWVFVSWGLLVGSCQTHKYFFLYWKMPH